MAKRTLTTPLTWNWRRVYTFALTAALVGFVWRVAERVEDIGLLRSAVKWSQWTILALVFTYVAGATATDWVQLVQAAKTTRKISEDVNGTADDAPGDGKLPPDQRVER